MSREETGRTLEVLLVEDNPGDARLTEEALKEGCVRHRLHVMKDGASALELVRREGDYRAAPRPDLILLDLNLPGQDGREVLDSLHDDPGLRDIPVVVLTGSEDEQDMLSAYKRHANFVKKPIDVKELAHVVQFPTELWATVIRTTE
jgi:CheY-like chemotaxis protein